MGLAKALNSKRKDTVREGVNTKEIEYMSAADYTEKISEYPAALAGFFIKEGDYGKLLTLIVEHDDTFIGLNVPKRYVEKFEAYDDEAVEYIKAGDLLISMITPDVKTPKGMTTMVEFIDREDIE
jgi:hypothetical protein